MMDRGLTNFTGQATVAAAWRSLVSTQDVVGIKVFSTAGMLSGTRPAVVAAVIHGLLDAGVPPQHIIIWDKHEDDLRAAGFFKLGRATRRARGRRRGKPVTTRRIFICPTPPSSAISSGAIWNSAKKAKASGENPSSPNWSAGKSPKSSASRRCSTRMTPAFAAIFTAWRWAAWTTRVRFEGDAGRLAVAVPEIYALPALGDRVVLNITDALIGQYEGGSRGLLHYSTVLNQLWFSRDPVALDTLAIKELDRERRALDAPEFKPNLELYANADLLQLGVNDPAKIQVEKLR